MPRIGVPLGIHVFVPGVERVYWGQCVDQASWCICASQVQLGVLLVQCNGVMSGQSHFYFRIVTSCLWLNVLFFNRVFVFLFGVVFLRLLWWVLSL